MLTSNDLRQEKERYEKMLKVARSSGFCIGESDGINLIKDETDNHVKFLERVISELKALLAHREILK